MAKHGATLLKQRYTLQWACACTYTHTHTHPLHTSDTSSSLQEISALFFFSCAPHPHTHNQDIHSHFFLALFFPFPLFLFLSLFTNFTFLKPNFLRGFWSCNLFPTIPSIIPEMWEEWDERNHNWQNSKSVISTRAAGRQEYLTYANGSTLDLKAFQRQTTHRVWATDVEVWAANTHTETLTHTHIVRKGWETPLEIVPRPITSQSD